MANPLETELKTFTEQREELLRHHRGKFVLIKGTDVVGAFDTIQAAYEEGIKRFGNAPMLIRPVLDQEPVESAPALSHGVLFAHP